MDEERKILLLTRILEVVFALLSITAICTLTFSCFMGGSLLGFFIFFSSALLAYSLFLVLRFMKKYPIILDIKSKAEYPANALSNFAAYSFEVDGIECSSMEGFLQSLKTSDEELQKKICKMVGIEAKNWGNDHNDEWKKTQTLYSQGKAYKRQSQEFQNYLDRAYEGLAKNKDFVKALLATGNKKLVHSIGKSDPTDTILTEEEFCSRLMKIRKEKKSNK